MTGEKTYSIELLISSLYIYPKEGLTTNAYSSHMKGNHSPYEQTEFSKALYRFDRVLMRNLYSDLSKTLRGKFSVTDDEYKDLFQIAMIRLMTVIRFEGGSFANKKFVSNFLSKRIAGEIKNQYKKSKKQEKRLSSIDFPITTEQGYPEVSYLLRVFLDRHPDFKNIILLTKKGYTQQEIAELLNLTRNNVARIKYDKKEELRKIISEQQSYTGIVDR